ncbi:toll/interleukin-1 receptor domain-containing protein [Frankia sp. Cas4]|uniref:toll/interleukin-1 receptor domain-containing protein n=1 Tax=Frankia sp. Cas4 TaxID=3073927 RepID=UPI003A0FD56F
MLQDGSGERGHVTEVSWDFFISYTESDRAWAEWVAWQLEVAGYRVLVQAWDFVTRRKLDDVDAGRYHGGAANHRPPVPRLSSVRIRSGRVAGSR